MSFVEFQNFDLNALTISAIATLFFTTIQAWGLLKQNKLIWREKSGEAVSITWFTCFGFMFAVIFIYGIEINAGALMYNGLLALFHIPVLIGLAKFKGFTLKQRLIFAACVLAVLIMILFPIKDEIFLTFSFISVVSLVMQPLEMWRSKSAGVVEIKLIKIYTAATAFWVIYAYSVGNWVMKITTPSALVVLIITIALWLKYRREG